MSSTFDDAARYRRLRVLGAAPCGSLGLAGGTVLRFSGLDGFVDADLRAVPSRGEATAAVPDLLVGYEDRTEGGEAGIGTGAAAPVELPEGWEERAKDHPLNRGFDDELLEMSRFGGQPRPVASLRAGRIWLDRRALSVEELAAIAVWAQSKRTA
jgi:hypothetical protein